MRACVRRTHLLRSTTFQPGPLATVFFVCLIAVVYSLTYLTTVRAWWTSSTTTSSPNSASCGRRHQVKGLEAVREVVEHKQAVDGTIEAADATIATFASLLRIAEVEAGTRRSAFRVLDLSRTAEKVAALHARAQLKGRACLGF